VKFRPLFGMSKLYTSAKKGILPFCKEVLLEDFCFEKETIPEEVNILCYSF
jgi:hypothetical protein